MRTNIHIKTRLSTTTNTQDRLNVAFLMIRRLKYENDVLTAKCEKEDKIIKSLERVRFFGTSECGICGIYDFCENMERCIGCCKYYCTSCVAGQLRVINCSKTCSGVRLCQDCGASDQYTKCAVCVYNVPTIDSRIKSPVL